MGTDEANAALLESWTLDLRSPVRPGKRPKAARTITHYLDEVNRFAAWLAAHDRPAGAPGDLEAVRRLDVVAWIGDMRQRGIAENTVRNRFIALKALYGWALDEEVVERSPVDRVSVARPDEPPPDVLPADDVKALLAACQGTGFYDRRDAALIRFMFATGARVSEVCGVAVDDIDLSLRVARFMGKGSKPRVARFDPTTATTIDRYKRARARHRYGRRPELWLGHRGPITRKGVPAILDKRAAMAGIGHVHPHQTRHTWAHRMKDSGASDEVMQQLAGWADARSLGRYGSSLAAERALAAYDGVDPMGDL